MSREHFEKYTNAELTTLIRSAMREGCIKPCHVYDAVDILLDRLADKPLRNCDVGTEGEQSRRFDKFCYDYMTYEYGCAHCPLVQAVCCEFAWGQMPYEEGAPDEQK